MNLHWPSAALAGPPRRTGVRSLCDECATPLLRDRNWLSQYKQWVDMPTSKKRRRPLDLPFALGVWLPPPWLRRPALDFIEGWSRRGHGYRRRGATSIWTDATIYSVTCGAPIAGPRCWPRWGSSPPG